MQEKLEKIFFSLSTEFLDWTKKLIPLYGELIFPHKYSNKLLIYSPHCVPTSIYFVHF